ncbi:MAG: type restriction enzyme protein [Synergistaceae bacterium]|nr:type restriction enzyme protein [Synergistaceae bacterium]MDI3533451.1 type restriction enzyme protein [Synergistaceae bacterium]
MITNLKPYPAYKPSGVEWLGEVPAHWEVLPYVQDAWYDPAGVKVGYEINVNRYFYKPKALRTLEEIRADLLAVEKETEGLLTEILGGVKP